MTDLRVFLVSMLSAVLLLWGCHANDDHPGSDDLTLHELDSIYEGAAKQYQMLCAGCHGARIEAFVDRNWPNGYAVDYLVGQIRDGNSDDGMPAFLDAMTESELQQMADYIIAAINNRGVYEFLESFDPEALFETEELSFRLEVVVDGLEIPWGMAFLPDGNLLVTDRNGKMYKTEGEDKQEIQNVPPVWSVGQGGLLDIELDPGFEDNARIYFSYSKPVESDGGTVSTTAVAMAVLNGYQLEEVTDIFIAEPYASTRHHYGSRLEFDDEGYLYISVGDRGNRDGFPQSLDNDCGKIHRILPDGSIPRDNISVYVHGANPSIWSYGHRNPQGMALNPWTGEIWTHEHGPRGGDEINIIRKHRNYGWPLVSYGINYDGSIFTTETEMEGMEPPLHYWVPSIAPCGMTFVTGERYPGWTGNLLVGSLRFRYLHRCVLADEKVVHEELLLKNIGRLRHVKQGPDGYIYIGVEDPGIIYRLLPATD